MTTIFWWFITGLALVGAGLNARMKWQGFVCWLVTNTAMCIKACVQSDWPQAVLWLAYTGLAILGLVSWLTKTHVR